MRWRWLIVLAMGFLQCGCVTFFKRYPQDVVVRDAETGKGIAGARVEVEYYRVLGLELNIPDAVSAKTDERGIAHLELATYENRRWSVSAEGYLPGWERPDKKGFVVELWRGPEPSVEFVIPNHYRGPLLLDYSALEKLPLGSASQGDEPGKRRFVLRPSPKGYIKIDGGGMFWRGFFRLPAKGMMFENSTPVPEEGPKTGSEEVVARRVAESGSRVLGVLGTAADAEAMKKKVFRLEGGKEVLDEKAFEAVFAEAAVEGGSAMP